MRFQKLEYEMDTDDVKELLGFKCYNVYWLWGFVLFWLEFLSSFFLGRGTGN